MRLIGTPPATVEEWLERFIEETEDAARREPWKRPWYLGRVSGLRSALHLVQVARLPELPESLLDPRD